jgi:hypothetical protein
MGGDFTLIAGLRHDWYTSSDLPIENQNFIDRNGFTNATNFDGESLTQPRLGFNWEVNDDLTLRGGVGMYSGGNPNVWLSNNYSNNGILTADSTHEWRRPRRQPTDLEYSAGYVRRCRRCDGQLRS